MSVMMRPQEEIEYFTFPELLEDGHTFAYNPALGTLQHLYNAHPYAKFQGQQQFTESEISLLLPLLHSFPSYAPYALLLVSFSYGPYGVTDERIEKGRRRLETALEDGTWDKKMRPLRNVLSRVRAKLVPFQLDVLSILETGYILHAQRKRA